MADRFMVTLHELTSAMDTYADALLRRDHGLSFNEFEYLVVVAEHGGSDVTELARCLRLTKAAVSKRLPALEAAGLVRRSSDPHHRRRVLVNLTERGGQLLQVASAQLEAELDTVFRPADSQQAELDTDRLNTDLLTLCKRIEAKELPK
ncbi:MarR family transcriptional regulator [Propionicimonas sp.]|uniref:MarR family winged helix-turn-helix transcriptional regulator n=1 Tax=Propionicimonas sp. TaxID=1955623 RepID=UPI001D36389E|nr:MarR family transcriptional regulator [Propionicimonas sp.]MBU3976387.1 MarR family transcriptional regulator [Actinomycetota bacterium]MBU3987544.1 MarR family transcriptional regulator [Actinomycetota bacterium]MBU4006511.1 MarR family transcriptional regulator [Actinomycetota bacterium]MBU4065116.1 MarR family transcriptional regulator [Actinomycetota bacterium]MBU4092204.1 MarR family transcriptional regulator [Actinomycetota bacterium]